MLVALLIVLLVGIVCDGKLVPACLNDEFPCKDGSCIKKELWCDAEINCNDKSDEELCFWSSTLRPNPNNCDERHFMCRNGPCIPIEGRCDGYISCHDGGSDEKDCPTENETDGNFTEVSTTSLDIKEHNTPSLSETKDFPQTTEGGLTTAKAEDEVVDQVQADSSGSEIRTKDKNIIEKGFEDIDATRFYQQRILAQKWLLSVRDEDYGWGDETARALIALYVSDNYSTSIQDKMMSKQLHVQLFTALIRNGTTTIPLWELSFFVNALSASCDDPRNFHGHNLVEILRHRTDVAEKSSAFITPLVYLTLCLHDATTFNDLAKVVEIFNNFWQTNKIDIEALVSLTATCISRIPRFESYSKMREVSTKLYFKVVQHGLPKNVYKLALVTQALNEARFNQDKWNRSEALDRIIEHQYANGSFGGILSTYYALPILSGNSLLSLRRHCDNEMDKDFTPMEILQNGDAEKIYITYSLYFGNPLEVSQTLMMKVKNQTNFLDIMRMAEAVNSAYKFQYDTREGGKAEVYSIGGVVNDPERGYYWKLHVDSSRKSNESTMSPYEGDLRNFKPDREDAVVFWFKSL